MFIKGNELILVMYQRGQVTVFVVIGLLVLGVFVGVYFLVSSGVTSSVEGETGGSDVSSSKDSVVKFVEKCINEQLILALDATSRHGGTLFHVDGDSVLLSDNFVKYAYSSTMKNVDKVMFEESIALYVDMSLPSCVGNFSSFSSTSVGVVSLGVNSKHDMAFLQTQGFLPSDFKSQSKVQISPNSVRVDTVFPLEIKQGDDVSRIESFTTSVQSPLGLGIEQANEVVSSLSQSKKLDLAVLAQNKGYTRLMSIGNEKYILSFYFEDNSVPSYMLFAIDGSSWGDSS